MKKNRIIIFLFLSYLFSCNSNNNYNTKKNLKTKENKFETYLNSYKEIKIGEEIDLSFKDLNMEGKEVSNNLNQFIPDHKVPIFLYGRVKDKKSIFFNAFYCTVSSNYMLNLITYNKRGEIISNIEIGEGCGSGFGYSCNEIFKIKKKNLFILEREEIIFNQDSLMIGKEIISEKFNYKVIYSLKNNGKIKIDTLKS